MDVRQSPALAIPARDAASSRRRDAMFFGLLATALVVVVFAGFVPGYHARIASHGVPMSPLLLCHIVAYGAWMLLHPTQALLAAGGRRAARWHRRLGMTGVALAAAMAYLGIAVLIERTRRVVSDGSYERNVTIEDLTVAFSALDVLAFVALLAAAIHLRRRPDAHQRLMVLATTALIGPAVLLLPGVTSFPTSVVVSLPVAPVIPLVVYDMLTRRRVLPVTLWGTAVIVGYHVAAVAFAGSGGAARLVEWMAGR